MLLRFLPVREHNCYLGNVEKCSSATTRSSSRPYVGTAMCLVLSWAKGGDVDEVKSGQVKCL
jgi:hypothetical protein